MADLLLEIGLEEVPARMLASAEAELARRTLELLGREHLLEEHHGYESFSTPRRLAVLVRGVRHQQPDVTEQIVGPSAKVAYKDGVATPAAEAFAKKAGVALDALQTITNAKGEYLAADVHRAGRSASDVICGLMPKEIASIYWAKSMYWRAGKPERFVRPLQWIAALLDHEVLPLEWAGKLAGRTTRGHRVLHGAEPVTLDYAAQYRERLESAHVLPHVEDRRYKIRKALDHVMRTVPEARWREDHALVDAVTHLTEWPTVLLGSFEAEYLTLPEEVLVTVMRDHQKYFAVEDSSGKLAPYFLTVLNTQPTEAATEVIRHGNERVLRARFNDARFFWDFDQKVSLIDRVEMLRNVTFQKELGSYFDKTERIRTLSAAFAVLLAERKTTVGISALEDAVQLSKTDLTSELVKEFTELQGVVGGLYARFQGHSEIVVNAIYDQYLPASMDDELPRSVEGLLLSIADKADTIGGMFGLGLEPTGSRDPFALRRAANGIVRILAERSLPLTLSEICTLATKDHETCIRMRGFLIERVDFYLREVKGQTYDVVKAVLSPGVEQVADAVARAEAVTAARDSDDFIAIAAAFKRMKNILDQARNKGEQIPSSGMKDLLVEPAERKLSDEAGRLAAWVDGLRRQQQYDKALQSIATLRPHVDAFFESVMVMAEEDNLRRARLGLLQRVSSDFSKIADFSEIVTAG